MSNLLNIKGLRASVYGKEILKGLDLNVNQGEIHVIMGPNGAGKSTLSNVLMGHPQYELTHGEIVFNGEVINDIKVNERAKRGIFLSFQYPEEVSGITVENFLRTAKGIVDGKTQSIFGFKKELMNKMNKLHIIPEYANRYLNVGFSGGEKKKSEILQMEILNPKLVILDETDSGLDVDAVKIVSEGVKNFFNEEKAIIIITHHNRILESLKPDFVHVLVDGKIVKTSDASLVSEIEANGYLGIKSIV